MLCWTLIVVLRFGVTMPTPRIAVNSYKTVRSMKDIVCSDGTRFQYTNIRTTIVCADICLADPGCMSFFYNKETEACKTMDSYSDNDSCKSSKGCRYFISKMCPFDAGYIYDSRTRVCFKFHKSKVNNWYAARNICQSEGGDLIKTDTEDKLKSIVYLLSNVMGTDTKHEYFLGGYYSVSEDVWKWVVDNSTIDDFKKDDEESCCLEIEVKGRELVFDDTNCVNQYQRYFCEISMTF